IGVCLTPVLLLLGSAGAPAAASTSVPVTIQSTVMIGAHTGTWSASGGITDAGTLVDVSDHLVGNGQIRVVRDVTGSPGTFTLRIDGSVTGAQPDGSIDFTDNWVVIAGTGGYAELRGQGTGSAVLAHGVVPETLTGSVHFDYRPADRDVVAHRPGDPVRAAVTGSAVPHCTSRPNEISTAGPAVTSPTPWRSSTPPPR